MNRYECQPANDTPIAGHNLATQFLDPLPPFLENLFLLVRDLSRRMTSYPVQDCLPNRHLRVAIRVWFVWDNPILVWHGNFGELENSLLHAACEWFLLGNKNLAETR